MAETEAKIACDVLVAGGGISGVSAAVAAARTGCRVMLLEKEKVLGGTGALGMLRTICGLYGTGEPAPAKTLNQGIAQEFVDVLQALSPQRAIRKIGKVFVLPYSAFELQWILWEMCGRERTLSVALDSTAVAVTAGGGQVREVTAYRNGSLTTITAQAVIDCTGSGDIAFMAGAEFDLAVPEQLQLAGFTVCLRGFPGRDESLALKVPFVLAEGVKAGRLPAFMRFTTYTQGHAPDEGYLKFNVSGTVDEQSVPGEVAQAILFLAERLPAFDNVAIVETSQGVFPREGRRILGDYTLTDEDVLAARKFTDGAVKNAWPIEVWDQQKGTVYRYVPEGDYYEIPSRCLTVKGFTNLLVAGRCISVSHEALGSTRVMGTCMALGEQAGRAAGALINTGKYSSLGDVK